MNRLPFDNFHIQGHRGARGYLPENTAASCIKALELGATGLEIDIVLSSDGQFVVNHDPFVPSTEGVKNIYKTPYSTVQNWHFGGAGHPRFPQQTSMLSVRPTLDSLLRDVFDFCKKHNYALPFFNIEIKSHPLWYGRYVPYPPQLVSTFKAYFNKNIGENGGFYVSSFDPLVLKAMRQKMPEMPLAYLTENRKSLRQNLQMLGFLPAIYSPYHRFLGQNTISNAHRLGIKVVTWTVNDPLKIKRLKAQGIDGVITDYPMSASVFQKNRI